MTRNLRPSDMTQENWGSAQELGACQAKLSRPGLEPPAPGLNRYWHPGSASVDTMRVCVSVIFVNENENGEKRENNEFVNEN